MKCSFRSKNPDATTLISSGLSFSEMQRTSQGLCLHHSAWPPNATEPFKQSDSETEINK